MSDFGEFVRAFRVRRELSQEAFALLFTKYIPNITTEDIVSVEASKELPDISFCVAFDRIRWGSIAHSERDEASNLWKSIMHDNYEAVIRKAWLDEYRRIHEINAKFAEASTSTPQ